jgi:hypothetical protein
MDEPADRIPDARAVFAELPEDQQRQIMGGRLDLLNAGQIDWADLASRRDNDAWRTSYVATPLRDLQLRADRRAAG